MWSEGLDPAAVARPVPIIATHKLLVALEHHDRLVYADQGRSVEVNRHETRLEGISRRPKRQHLVSCKAGSGNFADHPSRHTTLVLYDCGLQRIEQLPAQLSGEVHK